MWIKARELRVGIDVSSDWVGGVGSATLGLVRSLGELNGPEQYSIIVRNQNQVDWLKSHLGHNEKFVWKQPLTEQSKHSRVFGKSPKRQDLVSRVVRKLMYHTRVWRPQVPLNRRIYEVLSAFGDCGSEAEIIKNLYAAGSMSDGSYEQFGCQVVHFPIQMFVCCDVPSIYTPHDLQHLTCPQFFAPEEIAWREIVYPAGCRFAHTVVAGTQWIKDDIVRRYGIPPDKVQVIPWASPNRYYQKPPPGHMAITTEKYSLQRPFALFPAVTWPHKNHIRLLDALAFLRDRRRLIVNVVCTGSHDPLHWPAVEARTRELGLEAQVKFLGFVPEEDLCALYRLAQFLVMPTLYEAESCPVHEAWSEGLPVVSSNVTALPDQILEAGVLFDPMNVEAIASAIERVATNEELRDELRRRGYRRIKEFCWERTAKAYRAVFRRAANRPLTDEDRWLLQWDWMREPQRDRQSNSSRVAAS